MSVKRSVKHPAHGLILFKEICKVVKILYDVLREDRILGTSPENSDIAYGISCHYAL